MASNGRGDANVGQTRPSSSTPSNSMPSSSIANGRPEPPASEQSYPWKVGQVDDADSARTTAEGRSLGPSTPRDHRSLSIASLCHAEVKGTENSRSHAISLPVVVHRAEHKVLRALAVERPRDSRPPDPRSSFDHRQLEYWRQDMAPSPFERRSRDRPTYVDRITDSHFNMRSTSPYPAEHPTYSNAAEQRMLHSSNLFGPQVYPGWIAPYNRPHLDGLEGMSKGSEYSAPSESGRAHHIDGLTRRASERAGHGAAYGADLAAYDISHSSERRSSGISDILDSYPLPRAETWHRSANPETFEVQRHGRSDERGYRTDTPANQPILSGNARGPAQDQDTRPAAPHIYNGSTQAESTSPLPAQHASNARKSDVAEPRRIVPQRQPISCFPCRKRKLRCDGGQPCGPCVKRDPEPECSYAPAIRRRGKSYGRADEEKDKPSSSGSVKGYEVKAESGGQKRQGGQDGESRQTISRQNSANSVTLRSAREDSKQDRGEGVDHQFDENGHAGQAWNGDAGYLDARDLLAFEDGQVQGKGLS